MHVVASYGELPVYTRYAMTILAVHYQTTQSSTKILVFMVFGLEEPEIRFPNLYFVMLHCQGKGAYQAGRNVIPSLGYQHVRNLRRNCLQHCYSRKVLRHSRGLGFTTLLNRMINISQRNDNLGVNYFIGPG